MSNIAELIIVFWLKVKLSRQTIYFKVHLLGAVSFAVC